MREALIQLFEKAIQAVSPAYLLPAWIQSDADAVRVDDLSFPQRQFPKIKILAVGKAATDMARVTAELIMPRQYSGLIVTKHGHGLPVQGLELIEAGHPIPDLHSVDAAREILRHCEEADEETLILFLMSGGASALLTDLPHNSSLEELQETYQTLVGSGADINSINQLRKKLSPHIKGGKLAAAAMPASMVTLIISDVPGDLAADIGSGPTILQNSDPDILKSILEQFPSLQRIPANCLASILDHSSIPVADPFKVQHRIIGSNQVALKAMAAAVRPPGKAILRGEFLSGEADLAARRLLEEMEAMEKPEGFYYLAGGETTVTLRGTGKGGRNQQLALAAAIALDNSPLRDRVTVLAAGTDGTDGPTDATGAFVDADMLQQAKLKGLDLQHYLSNNDAYMFFKEVNGLLKTGPTGTNVMDVFIAWVAPR